MSIFRIALGCSVFAMTLAAVVAATSPPAGAQLSGGKVSLDATDVARGNKSTVTVNLSVGAKPVGLRRVFVKLRCTEQVDFSEVIAAEKDDKGKQIYPSKSVDIRKEEVLFQKEFTIAAGQELDARSHHNFKGEIEVPAGLPPSFKGKYSRIKWEASAGTDTTAWFDPATSWQEIAVK